MSLPKDFLDKMQTLLKEEYEAFINSYEQEKSLGLRVNTLKNRVRCQLGLLLKLYQVKRC